MASQAKKKKAKNSYIIDGAEKVRIGRLKRIFYYDKVQRLKNKKVEEYEYD